MSLSPARPQPGGGGKGGHSPRPGPAPTSAQHEEPHPVAVAAQRRSDDHQVILPPPTALNPIPALPVALRMDNHERFVALLAHNPVVSSFSSSLETSTPTSFRQLLVFGKAQLRTLLLRQVLDDPHTRNFGKQKKGHEKNWDEAGAFTATFPKHFLTNIVGTKLLLQKKNTTTTNPLAPQRTRTTWIGLEAGEQHTATTATAKKDATTTRGGGKKKNTKQQYAATTVKKTEEEDDIFRHPEELCQHVDVITYFLRPWDLDQTMAVIHRIRACSLQDYPLESEETKMANAKVEGTTTTTNSSSSDRTHRADLGFTLAPEVRNTTAMTTTTAHHPRSHKQHHRIVYVPQITAMCRQILDDWQVYPMMTSVSLHSLQLDLFPLESDLISLEYNEDDGGLFEAGNIEGTPSSLITTTARSLRKLQDVVGRIPRIQSLGIWGEEVLTKLLHETVEERYTLYPEDDDAAGNTTTKEEYLANIEQEDREVLEREQEEKKSDEEGGHGDTNYHDDDESSIDEDTEINRSGNTVMMLLDRRLDMVTPMVTPLTYEGLLDEVVGIDCGFITVDEQIINPKEDNDDDDTNEEGNSSGKTKSSEKNKSSTNPFEASEESTNPFDDDNERGGQAEVAVERNMVALGVHAGDTLFAEVRDQHVEKFGSFLQNQAIALKESHANFTSKETKKNLNEIHQFVKQIPIFTQSLRSLTNHIHLAELIKATTEEVSFREQWNTERAMIEGEACYEILEDLICSGYPPYKLLRLLCLQSMCSGGIKASKYDTFKQYIIQVYGYEFLPILVNLEKMGYIKKLDGVGVGGNLNFVTNLAETAATSRSLFQQIKRNLILIHAEVDTTDPDDISYVSSGYAPLTVRLIQSAMRGWIDSSSSSSGTGGSGSGSGQGDRDDTVIKDLFQMMSDMNNISGGNRLLDIKQTYPPRDLPTTLRKQAEKKQRRRHNSAASKKGNRSGSIEALGAYGKRKSIAAAGGSKSQTKKPQKPTLIVVYLGGVTYMEIASLRFLSKRDSFPYHIVVVTTKVINGSKLIQSMA